MRQELLIDNYGIEIFFKENEQNADVIYLHVTQPEEGNQINHLLLKEKALDGLVLVCIHVNDWNGDLTPWPATKVFSKGEDFAGHADKYFQFFNGCLKEQVENRIRSMGITIEKRLLAGYSLAGLFTLYVLTRTDCFQAAASVSGSFWYEGFTDYFISNTADWKKHGAGGCSKVYLSLGDKEAKTSNERMATVQDRTEFIYRYLKSVGVDTTFELNPGNHFANVSERMVKAIRWLKKDSTDKNRD